VTATWLGMTADGFAVADRVTGGQVSALPGVLGTKTAWALDEQTLSVLSASPGGWDIRRFSFPDLHPINAFPVVVASADGVRHTADVQVERAEDGGRLVIISDGVLSVWDQVGKQLGAPVTLGEGRTTWYQINPRMTVRPGHPGQLALVTSRGEGRAVGCRPRRAASEVLHLCGPGLVDTVRSGGVRMAVLTTARDNPGVGCLVGHPRPAGRSPLPR